MTDTATWATDFLDSIGFDSYLAYQDGHYADVPVLERAIAYLGVTHVRDGLTDGRDYQGNPNGSAPLSNYVALAQAGVRFTVVIDAYHATTASVDYQIDLARRLETAVPGSVQAIEGPNEINKFEADWNGRTGQAAALDLQRHLYSTVKADPVLHGADVVYLTGYGATGEGEGPDPSTTSGLADYDNQHPYPQGRAPAAYVDPKAALPNEPTPGPHYYTETGYTTDGADPAGVSEAYRAAATLDLLADTYKGGAKQTDLYQLLEAYPENYDSAYGAFTYAGDPTLAATAVHDLTAILKDDGATASTFTPKAIGVQLSGLPASGNSLQLQKSSGATDLLVWAERQPSDPVTTSPVTATLDGRYDVAVYDPTVGTSPVASYHDVDSVTLQVTDHPLIAELTPEAGAAPVTTPPAGSPPAANPPATAPTAGGTAPSTPAPSQPDPVVTTPSAASPAPAPSPVAQPDPAPVVTTSPPASASPGTAPAVPPRQPEPAPTVTTTPSPAAADPGAAPAVMPADPMVPVAPAAPPTLRERAMYALENLVAARLPHRLGSERWVMAEAIVGGMSDDHWAADRRLMAALHPGPEIVSVGQWDHDLGAPGAVQRFHALEQAYGRPHHG